MELSIVILNYKTKGLLKQCLRGIADSDLIPGHEVIVVDNHSLDGSAEMVREQFPRVQLIAANVNHGFAAGMNLGWHQAKGEYVLMLNPDVAVFGVAVEELLAYLRRHPRVGLAAPKLINPDGSSQISAFRFPTWAIPVLRRTGLGYLPFARRRLRRYLMAEWNRQDNRPVGWVLGACMLVRRQALVEAGGLDERFFLYFEDVDLCRRFWQAGWEVHFVADAEMVHYHRRLSADGSAWQTLFSYPNRVHIRSAIKYFLKFAGSPQPPHHL